MSGLSIGAACRELGVGADTLRYYEKIALIPRVPRDAGGRRRLQPRDLERLRFVRRAQAMDFSLDEIRELLHLWEQPQQPCRAARGLAVAKLAVIKQRLKVLRLLHDELALLVGLCDAAEQGCPILDDFAGAGKQSPKPAPR